MTSASLGEKYGATSQLGAHSFTTRKAQDNFAADIFEKSQHSD